MRPRKGKTQREQKKKDACYANGCGHLPAVNAQGRSVAKEEGRRDKEKIDREIRQNEKRNERDLAFPFKIKNADIASARGDPEAAAVDKEEET